MHLEKNGITSRGAKKIAENIPPNILVLSLSDNNIGDDGAKSMIPVAKKTQLAALYLEECNINDDGAKALIVEDVLKVIAVDPGLGKKATRFIYLRKNKLTAKCQTDLACEKENIHVITISKP